MKGESSAERMTGEREIYALFHAGMHAIPNSALDFRHRCGVVGGNCSVQNFNECVVVDHKADRHVIEDKKMVQKLEQNNFAVNSQIVDNGEKIGGSLDCQNAVGARRVAERFSALATHLKTDKSTK